MWKCFDFCRGGISGDDETGATNVTNSGDDAQIKIVKFTYHELETATNNFRDEIGEGRFGPVYRGKLESNDQIIVVKNLSHSVTQGVRMFVKEVTMLSRLHHPNLVNLIGYCAEGDKRLLVYEFLPLGSLNTHLYDRSEGARVLDWNTRMKIAVGAAKGLNYLHNEVDPPVIFRDLKSSNILLDEEFVPKLSDFGLAKFETPQVSNRDRSNDGYSAPEYATNRLHSIKTDVYSFGLVLLELISGYRPKDSEAHLLIEMGRPVFESPGANLLIFTDQRMKGNYPDGSLYKVLEVVFMCVGNDPESRPNMNDVVERITAAAAAEQTRNVDEDEERRRPLQSGKEIGETSGTKDDDDEDEIQEERG